MSRPAAAWPAPIARHLPGPWWYWTCQLLALSPLVAVAAWRDRRRRGTRDGLGVERAARFARRRDVRRLIVAGPTRGRTILGHVHGRYVATEERTSICVVGPSQSGKTSGLCIPVLNELAVGDGAVIAASVKGDLYHATHRQRRAIGDVKVFDPTGVLGATATWTPLRAAHTISGAQTAARALVDIAGSGGLEDADFWLSAAKELLWPLLFLAAVTGHTMADVVRWVTAQDRATYAPSGEMTSDGEVSLLLASLQATPPRTVPVALAQYADDRPPVVTNADIARVNNALSGTWKGDDRTTASIYTTARNVIEAWSDPIVAASAADCTITPEWLLDGDNTLYVIAPSRDQARLRPVFSSLIADLVHAAFDTANRNGGALDRNLLVMLDEAANICPVRQLPTWCSTCPSHGINLITVWQDRSQQRLRYGTDGAETIWNNSGAKLILSGLADHATAQVSGLLGEEEYERAMVAIDDDGSRRTTTMENQTRRLVSEDALRRQRHGQALLIYRDLPPMRVRLRRPDRRERTAGAPRVREHHPSHVLYKRRWRPHQGRRRSLR